MPRRLLTIVLFLSLGLNVALVAYNAMRWWQAQHTPTHDEIITEREDSFAALLPVDARDDLARSLHSRRSEIKDHMNTMKHLRNKIRKIMDQEPINDAALSKAFFDLRQEHDMMQQIYHDAFIDVARKLDVKARKNLTKSLHSRHGDADDDNDKDSPDKD
jgi:uncharacterized membrane protein